MTGERAFKRVFVLGADGFLGRAIAAQCRAADLPVDGVDRSPGAGVDVVRADIVGALSRAPDLVFHAAGLVGVGDDEALEEAHVGSTEILLEAIAERAPGARVLVLGSAAELGLPADGGQLTERETGQPHGAYGASKLRQSRLARTFAGEAGLDVVRVRLFNTLGPGQSDRLVGGAMVGRLADAVSRAEETLRVFDPASVRDYLDVRDVARCLLRIAARLPADPERAPVNVCSGEGLSVAGLAGELLAASGVDVKLTWESGEGPPTRCVGECPTLRNLMGGAEPRRVDTLTSLRDMWRARVGQEVQR